MRVGNGNLDKCRRVAARFDKIVIAVNRWLMIVALGSMSILVFIGVGLRYLSTGTLVWAEELSRYLMIWLAFLGIGPVLRAGGHVAVDTLMVALPLPLQRLLRLVVALLIAGASVWLLYAGWAYVGRSWHQSTPVLGIPFALVALSVPIGFALTLWHLLMMIGRFVADGEFEASDDIEPEQAAAS